ncbi:hypothetical protein RhiJN_23569 [Ceratobasidium sp. AG-Ba]|nr:hypothetical protein RhiJN_23569 [Ceratobasidium sp. AG-Ba]
MPNAVVRLALPGAPEFMDVTEHPQEVTPNTSDRQLPKKSTGGLAKLVKLDVPEGGFIG